MNFDEQHEIKYKGQRALVLVARGKPNIDVDVCGVYDSEEALAFDFANNVIGDAIPYENVPNAVAHLLGHREPGKLCECTIGGVTYSVWHTQLSSLCQADIKQAKAD